MFFSYDSFETSHGGESHQSSSLSILVATVSGSPEVEDTYNCFLGPGISLSCANFIVKLVGRGRVRVCCVY